MPVIMPPSRVQLTAHANLVVDAVKDRDGLDGKSAALERIIEEYEEKVLDPALRPPFKEDPEKVRRGGPRRARSVYEVFG